MPSHPAPHPAPQITDTSLAFESEFSHACALRDANDLAGAADAFGRLCLRYPARVESFKALGYVLYQLGLYERAPSPLLISFIRDPFDPTPLYFAAQCKRLGGDIGTAREIATHACEVARASHRYARVQTAAQHLIDTTSLL